MAEMRKAHLELRGCGFLRGRAPRERFELLDEAGGVCHDVNAIVTLSVQDHCRPGRADFVCCDRRGPRERTEARESDDRGRSGLEGHRVDAAYAVSFRSKVVEAQ